MPICNIKIVYTPNNGLSISYVVLAKGEYYKRHGLVTLRMNFYGNKEPSEQLRCNQKI